MELEDKRVLTPGVAEYAHRILNLVRELESCGVQDYMDYVDVDDLRVVIQGLEWRLALEDKPELKRELGVE